MRLLENVYKRNLTLFFKSREFSITESLQHRFWPNMTFYVITAIQNWYCWWVNNIISNVLTFTCGNTNHSINYCKLKRIIICRTAGTELDVCYKYRHLCLKTNICLEIRLTMWNKNVPFSCPQMTDDNESEGWKKSLAPDLAAKIPSRRHARGATPTECHWSPKKVKVVMAFYWNNQASFHFFQ